MADLIHFNGINGSTGDYTLPPMTGEELAQFISGQAPPENLKELQFRHQRSTQAHLGVKEGVDPKDVSQAGWGVIFAHDADPAVQEALAELIDFRRTQTSSRGDYFRLYQGGEKGFRRGKDGKNSWLSRQGAGPGPADPEKVPYYLLLVGDPEAIPYDFQYQLDVQYAVGRIHFDTLDEYAAYARSVVESEKGDGLAKSATFFGVANPDDTATNLSTEHLVAPLFQSLSQKHPEWSFNAILREEATKARLAGLLGGAETPALLFTASHGMEFAMADNRQLPHQGALLCQDWPGVNQWRQPQIPQDFYFAGDDIGDDAGLMGLIAFHFACYGAGTPLHDEFSKQAFKKREQIAPHPFLAGLPKRMLGHPRGGALATIGHVERAWGYSFIWPGAGAQTTVFESTLERLLTGHPVGSAVEFFNERYAELASDLSKEIEDIEFGKKVDAYELAGMWTANNDARSYVIIGDPAVRLAVAAGDPVPVRPSIHLEAGAPRVQKPGSRDPEAEVAATAPEAVSRARSIGAASPEVGFSIQSESQESAPIPIQSGALSAELASLTISTYGSGEVDAPPAKSLKFRTHISLTGDVDISLPAQIGPEEKELLAVHQETLKAALKARLALIKLLTNPS